MTMAEMRDAIQKLLVDLGHSGTLADKATRRIVEIFHEANRERVKQ